MEVDDKLPELFTLNKIVLVKSLFSISKFKASLGRSDLSLSECNCPSRCAGIKCKAAISSIMSFLLNQFNNAGQLSFRSFFDISKNPEYLPISFNIVLV